MVLNIKIDSLWGCEIILVTKEMTRLLKSLTAGRQVLWGLL